MRIWRTVVLSVTVCLLAMTAHAQEGINSLLILEIPAELQCGGCYPSA